MACMSVYANQLTPSRRPLRLYLISHILSLSSTGDKTASPLPQEQVITNNFEKFRRPITLPPSTLSDHMLLFASQEPDHPQVSHRKRYQLSNTENGGILHSN